MTEVTARVAMVILHDEGRVLMQLRDPDPAVYAAGMWGIFGGHVEDGEEPEQAARREIEEELGVVLDGRLDLVVHRIDDGRERFIFAAPLTIGLDGLRLQEGAGLALFTRAQLEQHPIVPVHREVLAAWHGTGESR